MPSSLPALGWSLAATLLCPSVYALPATPAMLEVQATPVIRVLQYDEAAASAKLSIPFRSPSAHWAVGADESLEIDISVTPALDPRWSSLSLNGEALTLDWVDGQSKSPWPLHHRTSDISSTDYLQVSWSGSTAAPGGDGRFDPSAIRNIHFNVGLVSPHKAAESPSFIGNSRTVGTAEFTLVVDSGPRPRLLEFQAINQMIQFNYLTHHGTYVENGVSDDTGVQGQDDRTDFDLAGELESLRLLEDKTRELHAQIVAKKLAISKGIREHREELCLRHLIHGCDGVISAAKAVAQRLCDKVGIQTDYTHLVREPHNSHDPSTVPQHRMNRMQAHMPNRMPGFRPHIPSIASLPPSPSSPDRDCRCPSSPSPNSRQPLIKILSIIAAVLGLGAICAWIRKRCLPMRTRVERAADLEQRRNERAYRRTARRALFRKRWQNFLDGINCFHYSSDSSARYPRRADYEEKRALILQDALLEQDLYHAERGDIMEAEIRSLRNAHDVVSRLVQTKGSRPPFSSALPSDEQLLHDPPPPLVPLPHALPTRSRASTGTLPSYCSETLPDYASRPDIEDDASSSGDSVVCASATSNSDEKSNHSVESRSSTPPPLPGLQSESTGSTTRYTPNSSVAACSPRISQETLQIRLSKEAQRHAAGQ